MFWKDIVTQAELFHKMRNTCQKFKERKTIYGHLPSKNIPELKLWDSVHVDLIGTYRKSIIQKQPGGSIIQKNVNIICMEMIDPATGWFEIFKIPTFDLKEVTIGNDEYMDR